MIKQLGHVCIWSPDLEASRRFYGDLLGLPLQFRFEKDGKLGGFYFRMGNNTFLEFFENPNGANPGMVQHFCLETDDLDGLRSKLAAAGVEVTEKKLGCDQSWQFWANDPTGIAIEFQEYTEDSLQFRGGVAEMDW